MSRPLTVGVVASLLGAIALFLTTPAWTVPVAYEVAQGSKGELGSSGKLDASHPPPMGGASLDDVNRSLTLDGDSAENTYNALSSIVMLDSADFDSQIMNGVPNASGYAGLIMRGSGSGAQRGRIAYSPSLACCGSAGPNLAVVGGMLLLDAANLDPSNGPNDDSEPLEIKRGGSAVPEPSAALVFGLGMLIFGSAVRKR